jgi:hypothetical protein
MIYEFSQACQVLNVSLTSNINVKSQREGADFDDILKNYL